MMAPQIPSNDPLAAARQHLDFEALAKGAPSSKTILFKAQTIVPMVPHKPWERIGKAGAGLAVALVLLFVPLIPTTTRLAMVKVQFENTFTRDKAQEVAYDMARNLPAQMLASAEFAEAPGQAADQHTGRLTLRLASLRLSPEELAEASHDSLDGVADAQPFITPTTAAQQRTWQSIPQAIATRLRKEDNKVSNFPPANTLANEIIGDSRMFGSALAAHLAKSGQHLVSFAFVDDGANALQPADSFLVPAWPRWMSVGVADYDALPRLQQQEIRTDAASFLGGMLLTSSGIVLADRPGQQLPVLLTVADRNGNADPVATRMVQAEFGSLLAEKPPVGKFETESLVNTALKSVLDGLDYKVDYRQYSVFEPGQAEDTYLATITINGKRRTGLKELSMPDDNGRGKEEF